MVVSRLAQVVVNYYLHVLPALARELCEITHAHVQEAALDEIVIGTTHTREIRVRGWRRHNCLHRICCHSGAPRLMSPDRPLVDNLLEPLIQQRGRLDTPLVQPSRIIVSDRLFLCSCDGVVVHRSAHGVLKLVQRIAVLQRAAEIILHLPRALEERRQLKDVALGARPRSEVSCPEGKPAVRVGEEIVCLQRKRDVRCPLRPKVLFWRRVEDVDTRILVHVMNQLVQVLVPDVRVIPLEVRSHHEHDVVSPKLVVIQDRLLDELLHLLRHVIALEPLVVADGVAGAGTKVEAKARRRSVVSIRPDLRENLLLGAEGFRGRPHHFHRRLKLPLQQIGVVRPAQNHRIKAKVHSKKVSLRRRVAKRV
mmetsp:Transcript_10665/g.20108  ORF Transcript_10665/g.20108 Transcript_10665/m.20108 type:complete len:366 (+) Transcript_10665:1578-2675(+)